MWLPFVADALNSPFTDSKVKPAEHSLRLTVGTDSLATGLKTGPPLIGAFASQVACFDCPVVPTLQISVVSPSMRSSAIPLSASLPCASRVIIGNDVSANDLSPL